jgi:uncharacterized protein (DUF1810 family)
MNPDDPHDLQRFLDAQETTHSRALAEIQNGRKESHWMWFIFPQAAGLGDSSMAVRYAIRSASEGRAYLAHPTLGTRLLDCTIALLPHEGRPISEIMGYPDDLKLCSSMSLFAALSAAGSPFHQVLDAFYHGIPDPRTTAFLKDHP